MNSVFALLLLLPMITWAGFQEDARAAWARREDPAQTLRAIQLWEQALKENPNQPALYIDLTRAAGRAYRHADRHARAEWADRARAYGAEAVKRNPDNAEAYAQYGAALGQWAQAHKGFKGLGIVKSAVNALAKSIKIDPHHGYAWMLLSQMHLNAPRGISVGDRAKALDEAKKAVASDPAMPEFHLALAKCYRALGQKMEARQELEIVIRLPAPAGYEPETRSQKEDAQDLLKDL